MRNYVQSSARPQFRIANVTSILTLGLGVAAVTTSGKKQLAFTLAATTMSIYADCALKYAHNFNDKLASELTPEFREAQQQINNNKLFIW